MARNINKEAVDIIDALLERDPVAKFAIENNKPRLLMVQAALACVGIKEVQENKGREVELFQKTVHVESGEPWCMCFVQTCLAYAEIKTKNNSFIYPSGACMSVWDKTAIGQRVVRFPLAGAIAIWQHTQKPSRGHTGIVLDCDGVTFHAIEGNTSDGQADLHGEIELKGDGVRYTHRRFDLFNPENGDMQLRGFLKPY